MRELECPQCKDSMIKSYQTEVKFRAKLIKWDRDGMKAVCKSCGCEVPISIDLMKSIQSSFVYEITAEKKNS